MADNAGDTTHFEQPNHSTYDEDVVDDANQPQNEDRGRWRDLVAFWILGLCNNFGFVVMLTAANDIIRELTGEYPVSERTRKFC